MAEDRARARSWWLRLAGGIALLFGATTIVSGGLVLFGEAERRAAAGAFVPFVLWFNFLAGFAYVAAGVGLLLQRPWAAWTSVAILTATIVVGGIFAWHVLGGGAYETRTLAAMTLRTAIWGAIAFVACRTLGCVWEPASERG